MGNVISPRQNEVGAIFNTSLEERQIQPYLTMKGAAAFLDVSISTIEKMSAKRIIPVYKPSRGKVYFKMQDLIDYIEAGKQQSIGEISKQALGKMVALKSYQNNNKIAETRQNNLNKDENGKNI